MRIHTDNLTEANVYAAATLARADVTVSRHGSRSRDHAFDVYLTGESRRRPNRSHETDEFAATWDQWGVFLAELFRLDPTVTIPRVYSDVEDFHWKTGTRFAVIGFPGDAHGDHTFRWQGVPCEQNCTKCSAVTRWRL